MTGTEARTDRVSPWGALLKLQLLGQVIGLIELTGARPLLGVWMRHPSAQCAAMALFVLLLFTVTRLTDRMVERGAARRTAYGAAVFSAIPLGFTAAFLTQAGYLAVIQLPIGTRDWFWQSTIYGSFDLSVLGIFGMVIYVNQRTTDRLLKDFRKAELRRAQLERQLVESRLAAEEARVDPAMLFQELGMVRLALEQDGGQAEERLNALIQSLRAAMIRTATVDGAEPLAT